MAYSTRYIMEQLARGRPMPQGSPDTELLREAQSINPMGIEGAIRKGARAEARNNAGVSALHVFLESPHLRHQHPDRIMACARALIRAGANPMTRHPRTGLSALSVAAKMAGGAWAIRWYSLWERRGHWTAREHDNTTPLERWRAKANSTLLERLPSPTPPKPGPKP